MTFEEWARDFMDKHPNYLPTPRDAFDARDAELAETHRERDALRALLAAPCGHQAMLDADGRCCDGTCENSVYRKPSAIRARMEAERDALRERLGEAERLLREEPRFCFQGTCRERFPSSEPCWACRRNAFLAAATPEGPPKDSPRAGAEPQTTPPNMTGVATMDAAPDGDDGRPNRRFDSADGGSSEPAIPPDATWITSARHIAGPSYNHREVRCPHGVGLEACPDLAHAVPVNERTWPPAREDGAPSTCLRCGAKPTYHEGSAVWCDDCFADYSAQGKRGSGELDADCAAWQTHRFATEKPRCQQCDTTLVLRCPEDCEQREVCESGCEEPVTHHDVDGVPLCQACWDELPKETPEDDPEGPVVPTREPPATPGTREPDPRQRCERTGNMCGTDTWDVGNECWCAACERWIATAPIEAINATLPVETGAGACKGECGGRGCDSRAGFHCSSCCDVQDDDASPTPGERAPTEGEREARALVNGHFGMVEKAHGGERLVEKIDAALAAREQEARAQAFREAAALCRGRAEQFRVDCYRPFAVEHERTADRSLPPEDDSPAPTATPVPAEPPEEGPVVHASLETREALAMLTRKWPVTPAAKCGKCGKCEGNGKNWSGFLPCPTCGGSGRATP